MRSVLPLGVVLGLSLAACGDRQPCPSDDDPGPRARLDVALGTCNRAPIIKVSGSRVVMKGATVRLDAAATIDPNGDAVRYRWALVSRPASSNAVLMGATERTMSFVVDQVGAFTVSLEASDGELSVSAPPIVVTATNDAPVASAGADVSVDLGGLATLDGSGSSDVNGDTLTFSWSIATQPIGSQAVLESADTVAPTLVPEVRGPYELLLTVSDGELSATDSVLVRAGISAHVPDAVASTTTPTVAVDARVQVDGSRSSDADGDPLGYSWVLAEVPPNSIAALSDTRVVSPTFVADQPGQYRLELTVDDGYHHSPVSTVFVTAFGDPRIRCTNTIPFTNSATLSGSTAGGGDDYETGCGPTGQDDVILEYVAPADLDSLDVELVAGFNAVLAVYVDDCGPAARRACVTGTQSTASLGRVRAGERVAIIVDGGAMGASGAYQVAVSGRLASDQACIPGDTSFTCDLGACAGTPTGPRCPAILDCADGVDADRDGRVDEDPCSSAPSLTCPADLRVDVLATTSLAATRTSTSPIVRRRWTVEDEPLGSSLAPSPRDQPSTSIRPLLYGDYRLRYTEIDDDLETSSCETVVSAGTRDALRVELIWNPTIPEELHASDVDMHLLHPDATAWWNDLDCYFGNGRPEWDDPVTEEDNPRLDLDDTSGRGPENINILAPSPGQSYRVGAHYFSDHGYGPAAVYVNVYCYGQISQRFGPVTLTNDQFWKIADVRVDTSSCTVAPLGRPNVPLIVSESDSRTAR